jgi:DNA-binding GntR family transcriptional regulator
VDRNETSEVLEVRRLAPEERNPDGIFAYVRELILNGTIPPGTPISQVALSRSLGVSRTPLRETMRRLQQEGLLQAEHNRRARVIAFDPDDLELVYSNRLLLETLAIAVTVPRLGSADLDVIEAAIHDMQTASTAHDEDAYDVAHRQFHMALGMHADPKLQHSIASFADRGDRYRRLYRFTVPGATGVGASEHEAIFEACRVGDQGAAVVALARHLSHTALALIAKMAPERDPVSVRTALRMVTGLLG